jgi:hypothetical protein
MGSEVWLNPLSWGQFRLTGTGYEPCMSAYMIHVYDFQSQVLFNWLIYFHCALNVSPLSNLLWKYEMLFLELSTMDAKLKKSTYLFKMYFESK